MGSEDNNKISEKIIVSFPEVLINNDNNNNNDIVLEDAYLNIDNTKKNVKKVNFNFLKKNVIYLIFGMIIILIFIFIIYCYNNYDIEKLKDNVVLIIVSNKDGKQIASGSGVYVNSDTIYTNAHVIEEASLLEVILEDNTKVKVKGIQAVDEDMDIAIIVTEEVNGMRKLKTSSKVKIGSPVYAIGSPIGLKNTISDGVLSREYDDNGLIVYQHTAPISSGSSGGALFNKRGELIGINYATYKDAQNINLAIKVEYFNDVYDQTKNDELISIETSDFFDIEEMNSTNGKKVMTEVCSVDVNCRAFIDKNEMEEDVYKNIKNNIEKSIVIESISGYDIEYSDNEWLRINIFKIKEDNDETREEFKKIVDYRVLGTRDTYYNLKFKHYWSINKDYYYYIEYSDNIDISNLIKYLNNISGDKND